jgi:hypothetical protein
MRQARYGFIAAAILALSVTASANQASVAGDWALNFNGPQGPIDASASFKQDGEDVTGTIEGPQGTIECAGTLKGNKLALQITVDANGQSFQIFLLGEVEGNAITGTFSMAEMRGEWTGKKK